MGKDVVNWLLKWAKMWSIGYLSGQRCGQLVTEVGKDVVNWLLKWAKMWSIGYLSGQRCGQLVT